MKHYILLCDATRDDLETVDDYEMDEFDPTIFWTGDCFDGSIPDEVRIRLDTGQQSDLLGNPIPWLIISNRLRALIQPFCHAHVQFVPITLWRGGTASSNYVLANPLGCIDAIVSKKKKQVNIQNLKLDSSKIPSDRHLFRLKHLETTYIISETLFQELKGKGLRGVAAREALVI